MEAAKEVKQMQPALTLLLGLALLALGGRLLAAASAALRLPPAIVSLLQGFALG
jgi:hypothetical protein